MKSLENQWKINEITRKSLPHGYHGNNDTFYYTIYSRCFI